MEKISKTEKAVGCGCEKYYAFILNEEVKNTVVADNYEIANQIAKATYGNEAFAVDMTYYVVWIGCKYINNTFYEPDGVTPCKQILTPEQMADSALFKIFTIDNAIFELLCEPEEFTFESKTALLLARMVGEEIIKLEDIPEKKNLRKAVEECINS